MNKKMRRIIALVLAFVMAFPMVVMASGELTESTSRVFVDGAEVSTSTSLGGGIGRKPAFNVDGTTFMAARAMGIAFERDIMWQPYTQTLYFGQAPEPSNLVTVTAFGASVHMSLEQIHALGMNEFDAISNNNPMSFAGVSFVDLFAEMGVDVSSAQYFIFVAADSFYNVAAADDVLNGQNGWLAFYENGERLETRTRVVLVDDGSPGRWVRDVKEIIAVDAPVPNVWTREINIVADGVTVNAVDAHGNDASPFMHRGKIYIPLRATANALGMAVEWNEGENSIIIGAGIDVYVRETVGGGELAINAGGEQFIVTMDNVLYMGLEDFYAVIRGERRDYTGVSIARIMEFLDLDVSAATGQVTFDTRDGHGTAATVDEVFDPTNGFIAISEGGELLGHWEDGGRGPFMLVFAQDLFAQRFMRYLTDINIDMPLDEQVEADTVITIEAGNNTFSFTADELIALGTQPIDVVFRGNPRNFTGVPAIEIFNELGIDTAGFISGVVISGDATGFTQPFTIDELLDDTQFFLAYREEGEVLESIMSVFAQDDRPTRGVRGVAIIRLLDGGELEEADSASIDGLEEGEFAIIRGSDTWTITMEELEAIGFVDFTTNIPTGGGSVRNFTGVRLTAILEARDINIAGASNLITSSHGSTFNAAWNVDADLDYIYIAVAEDGEVLSPHSGPFFGVVRDRGANFNPRNLESITIN